jgi:hypothetical protein
MTNEIQTLIQSAFEERLAERDTTAAARLLVIDYRPRRGRRRLMLPALGGISLAGIISAIAVVLSLGTAAAPAFAHWTATPTKAAPVASQKALAQCRADDSLFGQPVLVDSRGPFTAAVWNTHTAGGLSSCIDAPSLHGSGSASQSDFTHVRPSGIQRSTSEVIFTNPGGAERARATILYGRVGVDVRGVKVRLSDGTVVTATVSHGYYLAWWPGKVTGTTATVLTTSGLETVKVPPVDAFKGPAASKPANSAQAAVPASALLVAAPVDQGATQTARALTKCRDTEDVVGAPVVVDTRGPFTAAVWNTNLVTGQMICVTGPSLNGGGGASQTDFSKVGPTGIQRSIMHVSFSASPTEPASEVTALYGRAGREVTGVEVHLNDGSTISAAIDHGDYVAWWSGTATGTTATITTTIGNRTVNVPAIDGFNSR